MPDTAGLEALRGGTGKDAIGQLDSGCKTRVLSLSLLAMICKHRSQTILMDSFLFRASLATHLQPNFFVVNRVGAAE